MITKSSAGSGKTYNLAKRYLQNLIHEKCDIKNILAITFTNKAALEMRERILQWMKKIILRLPFAKAPGKTVNTILAEKLNVYQSFRQL